MRQYGLLTYGLCSGLIVLTVVCTAAHPVTILTPHEAESLRPESVAVQVAQATSATRALSVVPVQDHSGQQVGSYSASYALVVGVSIYTGGWPSLPGVKEDVRAVQEALQTQGFQVTMVLDPTKAQLEEAFAKFISAYGGDKDHRLLVYFAGHGHTIRPQYGGNPLGYLVPQDAPNPHDDPNGFKRLALSMQRIEEYALTIDAKHVLFLFDSCFSGSLFALTRAVPEHISYKTAQPVRQFITSGDENEQVPDKSIFREQLIAALRGEADTNGDGYVTGTELGEFLQNRVVNYSREGQHPQYGKIRHPQLDKGDFVFRVAATAASLPAAADPNAALEAERRQLATEKQRFAEDKRLLEEQQRLAEERRSLEAEHQHLATERQKLAPPTPRGERQETARLAQPPQPPPQEALPSFMTRLLTEQDLRGKSQWELNLMRNEIFARHGRHFRRPALQKYFESQPWYKGQYTPEAFDKIAASLLSDIQKKNATFLMEYQKRQ